MTSSCGLKMLGRGDGSASAPDSQQPHLVLNPNPNITQEAVLNQRSLKSASRMGDMEILAREGL